MPSIEPNAESGRILIVDDHPTNIAVLAGALRSAGHEIISAGDGFLGEKLAREQRPDVILLDVMMPGRDGLDVCRALKADPATADIPIIFVTAMTESQQIVQGLSAGGCDYITKPVIPAEVKARVSVHLRLSRAEATLRQRNQHLERASIHLAELNTQLAQMARTDPLTKLLNRGAWQEALVFEHERAARYGARYSVVMMDVDHFKALNDSRGHAAGDDCLRRLAECLTSGRRETDLVGRIGGEEFAILCPETDPTGASLLAERLRLAICDLAIPHPASPVAPHITASFGVAGGGQAGWEELMRQVDAALYAAKAQGRNCVVAAEDLRPCTAESR